VAAEALLLVGMSLLDLPRAVSHLMVRRVQAKMRPPAAAEGGVSWAVFESCYSHLERGEEDKVRLFRVLRDPVRSWLVRADVEQLVWAVADTHPGLEFLRDSAEFRSAYVETATLRIMWSLGGSGVQRIPLQRWRRSGLPDVLFQLDPNPNPTPNPIPNPNPNSNPHPHPNPNSHLHPNPHPHPNPTQVLFQLDDEGDINLVRDYFSYNHFYVIWCLFWELDEDEDSLLHTDDLLRYGSDPNPNPNPKP